MPQQQDKDDMKNYDNKSALIMETWLDGRIKKQPVAKSQKMPETTYQECVEEIKENFSKVQKKIDPKLKEANIEPLEHQEMNLEHEYWVTKFLYPFALDPTKVHGGEVTGKKFNVLDTTRF